MSDFIRVSPKHGVNPALVACWICGEDTREVALLGLLRGDAEAPRRVNIGSPCDRCREIIAGGGVFIIEAVQSPGAKPERTGRLSAITGEAFDRMFNVPRPPKGIAYADPGTYSKVFGLPGEELPL